MNDKLFTETYCHNCGTQRCEGIGTEWFNGCKYRWNHDSYDAATEIYGERGSEVSESKNQIGHDA